MRQGTMSFAGAPVIAAANEAGDQGSPANGPSAKPAAAVSMSGHTIRLSPSKPLRAARPSSPFGHASGAGRNHARAIMGRKYAAFRILLTASATMGQANPPSRPPRPRPHFDTKPAIGGTPMIPSAATVNAVIVTGMRRPTPSIRLTR